MEEAFEAAPEVYANELEAALPRLRGSWERLTDSFLSYYLEATLDDSEEREEAIRIRSRLHRVEGKVDQLLTVFQEERASVERWMDIASLDSFAERHIEALEMLAEEFSVMLSYIYRMISILDVRLKAASQHAATG